MKKVILFIGLLLVVQLSFSQTTVRYVILKADDLVDAGGSTGPGRLSSAWREFNQMVIDFNIKANWGINGSRCNYATSGSFWNEINNLRTTGRFELWNHGYVHSPNPQHSDIVANQDLVRAKTGTTMIAFGAPENQSDAGTYTSLNSLNDIEYIMFGDPTKTSKTIWARDLNIESPTLVPNYAAFVSNYPGAIQNAQSNGRDYLCLQVHPNSHTPYMGSRQTNLRDCINYLKDRGLIFVTISEYKALHGGTTQPPICGTTVAWSNSAFTAQTGSFTPEFDVVPGGANMDGVVGLSNGAATAFTSLACAVQFATDGTIKARNGAAYAAATSVNYTAGTSYHVRMDVNVASKTYSVYVTPAGGSQQTIGTGYAFRTEQNTVTQLSNRAINTLSCSLAVTNFTAGSVVTAPSAPTGLTATAGDAQVSLSWSASSGATSYNVKRSTTSGSGYTSVATGITSTSYVNTGLTNGTAYYYVVTATNSGGTSGNSAQATATPVAPPTSLINEQFTTSASNFTVVRGGTWAVSSGKYVLSAAGTTGTANGNISVHNTSVSGVFTLTADASATSNTASAWDDFSIIFNYTDANNYYYVSMNESNDPNTSGIFKISGGVVTQLADITSLITAGTTYSIKVVKNGNSITVSRNNIQVATASDPTFTSGKVGFGSLNNGATFDNLVVSSGVSASVVNISDAQTTELTSTMSVFPNPTSGRFSLSVDHQLSGGNLMIIDVLGNKVLSKQLKGNTADLDLTSKPNGVYIINVVKDGKQMKSRFIKK